MLLVAFLHSPCNISSLMLEISSVLALTHWAMLAAIIVLPREFTALSLVVARFLLTTTA